MNKHSFFKLLPILFLLQGCYVYTTGLLAVESEPLEMKTVKTISYNEIETSIIAQRANKIIKEQLRKSGWKIVYKDNGDYISMDYMIGTKESFSTEDNIERITKCFLELKLHRTEVEDGE